MHTLILLLAAPASCLAQAPAPAIHFEKTHHDFGEIPENKLGVSCRFSVANTGSAALRIREVRASCGCSSVSIGSRYLAPGEGTAIEVQFDPKGLSGNVHKTLEVLSNDPMEPSTKLTFEATVIRGIMPSPTSVFFGNVQRYGKASASVRLRSMDGRPVEVASAKIPNAPYLSCTHYRDGLDAVLDISMDGGLIPKLTYNGADLLTVITKDQECPKFEFKVSWDMPTPITAAPARISLLGAPGGELRATIVVGSAGGEAFRILRATPSSPLIGVEDLSQGNAPSHTLEVVFSKKAKVGGYHEKLTLHLDHPEQRTLEVGVAAVLRP
jgi:hypothetical protein